MSDTAAAAVVKRSGPRPKQRPEKARRAIPTRKLFQLPAGAMPVLSIQKFKLPGKHYRLVWTIGQRFWFCAEDETEYQKRYGEGGVIEAGKVLAGELKVRFEG